MAQVKPFLFGTILMAVLLGFLVGASSSPIAGAAVTSGFGIVAAMLAAVQAKGLPESKPSRRAHAKAPDPQVFPLATLNALGWCLVVFCTAFSAGLASGVAARVQFAGPQSPPAFPWRGAATPPSSIRVAVDWIALKRLLSEAGYTDSQIEELYRLSGNGAVPPDILRNDPNADLLSPILSRATHAPAVAADKAPTLIVDRPTNSATANPS